MPDQPTVFPVTQHELENTSFRLADLMTELENAEAAFALARDDHKDHLKALRKDMAECKRIIRLAKSQRARPEPLTEPGESVDTERPTARQRR